MCCFSVPLKFNFGSRNREFASPKWRRRCSDMTHQLFFFTRATPQIFMIAEGNFTVQAVLFTVQILAARRGEALHTRNKFLLLFCNCCYEEDPLSRHPFPPWAMISSETQFWPYSATFSVIGSTGSITSVLLEYFVVFDPMKYTLRTLIVLRLGYCA